MTEPDSGEFDEASAYQDAWDESGPKPKPTPPQRWDHETEIEFKKRTAADVVDSLRGELGLTPVPQAQQKDPRATTPDHGMPADVRSTLPEAVPAPMPAIDAPRRVQLPSGGAQRPPGSKSALAPPPVFRPPPPTPPPPQPIDDDEAHTEIPPPRANPGDRVVGSKRIMAGPLHNALSAVPSRAAPAPPPPMPGAPSAPPPPIFDLKMTPPSGLSDPRAVSPVVTSPGLKVTEFIPDGLLNAAAAAPTALPAELQWKAPPPSAGAPPVRPELAIQATPAVLTWGPNAVPASPPPRPDLIAQATPAELRWAAPKAQAAPAHPPAPAPARARAEAIPDSKPLPSMPPPLPRRSDIGVSESWDGISDPEVPQQPRPTALDMSPPVFDAGIDPEASLALEAIDEALAAAHESPSFEPSQDLNLPQIGPTLGLSGSRPAAPPSHPSAPPAPTRLIPQRITSRHPAPPTLPPAPAPPGPLERSTIHDLAALAGDLARDPVSSARASAPPPSPPPPLAAPSVTMPPDEPRRIALPVGREGAPTMNIDGQAVALQYAVDLSLGLRKGVLAPEVVVQGQRSSGNFAPPSPPFAPPTYAAPSAFGPPPDFSVPSAVGPPPVLAPAHSLLPAPSLALPLRPIGSAPGPAAPPPPVFETDLTVPAVPMLSANEMPLQSAADLMSIDTRGNSAPDRAVSASNLELAGPVRPTRPTPRLRPALDARDSARGAGTSPALKIAIGLLLATIVLLIYTLLR